MELSQEIISITNAIRNEIPAERIYLFGSHAKGSSGETSDYDFYVLIPDGSMRPLNAAMRAQRALSAIECKTPVDVIADYQSRFDERRLLNTFERTVWNEGVVLYERA
jgi:predicted nucleotidyltransferase